jgi:hypothetical protein
MPKTEIGAEVGGGEKQSRTWALRTSDPGYSLVGSRETGGVYEPSISCVIKNPVLGIFNHLPLKRLRTCAPAPRGFGEFDARLVGSGGRGGVLLVLF